MNYDAKIHIIYHIYIMHEVLLLYKYYIIIYEGVYQIVSYTKFNLMPILNLATYYK